MILFSGRYGFGVFFSSALLALILNLAGANRVVAQDDLADGITRLQGALDQIVGDGTFDLADEEFCRNVLWTDFILLDESNKEKLSDLTDENYGVMTLTAQIQKSLDRQAQYMFLYQLALDRQSSVGHPSELSPDADQFASACSLLVQKQMEDPASADAAESARSTASFGAISNLLYQLLKERRN